MNSLKSDAMKSDLKKIKKYAREQINSGRPKEDVFNEIYSGCNDHRLFEKIATIVQYIPDPVRLEKYGIYNTLFLLFMIAIDIVLVITFNFEPLLLTLCLTFLVAGRKTKYYQWITFLGGITFITVPLIGLLSSNDANKISVTSGAAVMIISLIIIMLSATLPGFLTPDYKVVEELKLDDDMKEIKVKRISFN